jgi:hypothetical protein
MFSTRRQTGRAEQDRLKNGRREGGGAHAWRKHIAPRENTHSNAAGTYLELMRTERGTGGEHRDGKTRESSVPGTNGSNKRDPRDPSDTRNSTPPPRKHALKSGQYIPRAGASSARREQTDKQRSKGGRNLKTQGRIAATNRTARGPRLTPTTTRTSRKHALKSGQNIPRADERSARRGRVERQSKQGGCADVQQRQCSNVATS